MTLHAPHLGGISAFVHTHHVASIIAAVAVVGGGTAVAGVAWNSTQSTLPPAASQASHMSSQATRQLHQWTAHHRAYKTQMAWLRQHHGYQNQQWLAHYRGYQHQLNWMLGHRGWAHGDSLGHYRAYETRMHWLREHWAWSGPHMRSSSWYHGNHNWMNDHMGGTWQHDASHSWH